MAKKITLEEFKSELQRFCKEYIDGCLADYEGRNDSAKVLHWFEEVYMQKHLADMCLDHTTFRLFLRLVLSQYYTKKDVDKLLSDQKWFLLDFINESILTVLPYKNENGELMTDKPIEELIGRVLYDFQNGVFTQYRDDAEGNIFNYVLSEEELRDFQIVFMENMPTLEESIYYMKDEKLQSILASEEHAGLMSKEDKIKLDKTTPDEYLKEVSIGGENLPKENAVVDIPKATNTTLGVVKGGENVTIGEDGSVNVDVPVSIDEVVNLRSITTEPSTANEGDCYYNSTTTLIHYYIDDAWDTGAEPEKSKVYFFEDGKSIHQYRSDGDRLIEIQDTPQIATNTTVGIVKGGENVNIGEDGSVNVSFETIEDKIEDIEKSVQELPEPKEYGVATTTELGLVMASHETNNSAEEIAEDGNVQVSEEGKMLVRKIWDEKNVGYDKNRFVVNPDKRIEELKDRGWQYVTSNKETVTSKLTLTARYTYPLKDYSFDTENAIKKGLLHIDFTEGGGPVTLTVSGPEVIRDRPGKYRDRITSGTCNNGGKPIIRLEYYECVYYDIKLTSSIYHTDQDPKGIIDGDTSISYGKRVSKFTIKTPGDYYVFLQTTSSYLEPIEGTNTSFCLTGNLKNDKASETPYPKEKATLTCSYTRKEVINYSGQNIILGKNGLLIEGPKGEAYVKVTEDGEVEHTFGATQNTGQANVIESVQVNGVPLEVKNKNVEIKISQNGEVITPNADGSIDIKGGGGGGAVSLWDENSNLNNCTETGIYHFYGYRTNANDNLPIESIGENTNIAFTLIVDRANGYYNETDTTINDIPGIISQTIFLGNRQGSETRVYVRNGNIQYTATDSEGEITWEVWRELMQTTYLDVLNETHDGETLKSVTENGLYTGAFFYPPDTFDIFKLEVMNNYAMAEVYGSANTVYQHLTILDRLGRDKVYSRKGVWNGSAYDWGEWTNEDTATVHKRGDVVILQQKQDSSGLSLGTKVISWEEFKNTYPKYAYPGNRYTPGEFPIGLVVDPAKRTFLYLRQLPKTVYTGIKSSISGIESTMYSNGIENSYQIKKRANISFATSDSIFYSGSGNQLKQFIPSYAESAMRTQIEEYGSEAFYQRLLELSELMQDSTNYPGVLTEPTNSVENNVFYCFNSTIIKDGETFYIGDALGGFQVVSDMHSGFMEFFGIYFND